MTLRSSQPTRDFIRLLNMGLDQSSQPCSMYDHNELDALRDPQVPGAAPRPAGQAHVQTRRVNSEVQGLAWFPPFIRIASLQPWACKAKGIQACLCHSDIPVALDSWVETPKEEAREALDKQAAVPDIISAQAEVAQR